MAATIPEFRDDTVRDPTTLRLRLNQLVKRTNEVGPRFKTVRLPTVMTGQSIVLQSPGFTVVAVTLAGVNRIDAGAALATSPWVSWFTQQDGTVNVSINGLAALPAKYAVNLVLFEGEATP